MICICCVGDGFDGDDACGDGAIVHLRRRRCRSGCHDVSGRCDGFEIGYPCLVRSLSSDGLVVDEDLTRLLSRPTAASNGGRLLYSASHRPPLLRSVFRFSCEASLSVIGSRQSLWHVEQHCDCRSP